VVEVEEALRRDLEKRMLSMRPGSTQADGSKLDAESYAIEMSHLRGGKDAILRLWREREGLIKLLRKENEDDE